MNFTILRFDSIESTNTEAVNQAKRGAEEGLCIVAERQTAGRGRRGRNWSFAKRRRTLFQHRFTSGDRNEIFIVC